MDVYKLPDTLSNNSKNGSNGNAFLTTFPEAKIANIAYDEDGEYVYVDLPGNRVRFLVDWWVADYKSKEE